LTRRSSSNENLALLPLLLRPLGEDLVHGVAQRSVPLGRRTAQLRLQLWLDQCPNKFGSLHAATVGHGRVWRQRTADPIFRVQPPQTDDLKAPTAGPRLAARGRKGEKAMERYDDAWVRKMAAEEARKGGLVGSRFAECKTVFDVIEVLDEICWVLPKEERAKAKLPASKLTADELRRLIPGAPDTALAALVLKAQLIAHPDHWRPRLVVDNTKIAPPQV
jgi:hypothetical protein